MKKLGAAIEGKMKQAHDWCADGDAPIGGLGQKAIYRFDMEYYALERAPLSH